MENELLKNVLTKIGVQLPDLLLEIVTECCEDVQKSAIADEHKVEAVFGAFLSNTKTMKSTFDANLSIVRTFTLNYRGQSFRLTKQSPSYLVLAKLCE